MYLSSFLWDNRFYKILEDTYVRLPNSGRWAFGVYKKNELDETLTRQFFGATDKELAALLLLFYSAVYRPTTSEDRRARLTSSRQSNRCALTGAFIPEHFPYIVFDDHGHVSLNGFYYYLGFLCRGKGASFKMLVAQGADPELILRLCEGAESATFFKFE